jgi:cation/acetate symporter
MGALAISLGIVLEGQNIAFMVGLAFAVAASANFPALVMAIFLAAVHDLGSRLQHSRGCDLGAGADLHLAAIQVDVLGHEDAPFPLLNPALISMPLAFGVGILVSLLRPEPDAAAKFIEAERRIHLGTTAVRPPAGAPARAR